MSKLTDTEKRIFLEAMRREREVCERYERENNGGETVLSYVCKRIVAKVMGELW